MRFRDPTAGRIELGGVPLTELAGAADLQRRITALAAEGGPGVLVITHERAALDAFDEVLELRDGRIVAA